MRVRAAGCLALMLCVALAGCASGEGRREDPWHGRDLAAAGWIQQELGSGSVYEVVFTRAPGTSIEWDWVVPSKVAVEFMVHTHAANGQDVLYNRTTANQDKGKLVAPERNQYGLQWTNQGRDAVLYVKLPADGRATYFPATTAR